MTDHSRVLLLGSRATEASIPRLKRRLNRSCTHITADSTSSGAVLTVNVLMSTLRRMPGNLSIDPRGLPNGFLKSAIDHWNRIDPSHAVRVTEAAPDGAVHLHVGTTTSDPGAIRVVPDGYGGQVVGGADVAIRIARPAHPLGSIFTAAMAAAEVFKITAGVLEARCTKHRHLAWCPVSLSDDLTAAPMQDAAFKLDIALVGCGSVGTAIAMILEQLHAVGSVMLVDRQHFAPENVQTYSLGDSRDAMGRPRKVNLVGQHLTRYQITRFHGDVGDLPALVDACDIRWPRVVLSGLDSIAARHHVQRLWPDRIIDVGTGDTAVGLHDVMGSNSACLFCFFPAAAGESAMVRMSDLTGLAVDRLARGDDPLLAEEIAHLDIQRQELLRPYIGKPVCGLASALGLVGEDGGYRPAVPFIAQQAACLAVGRLIAAELGIDHLPNFIEYDGLVGPVPDIAERRLPSAACYCQQRAALIGRVRDARRAGQQR